MGLFVCVMSVVAVSVIVPVYNVEKYIERCARILFEQTLNNMEYIFVNDCTPDNSMLVLQNVLKEYPNRKQQVRIINFEKNEGAAKARRVGMEEAAGEYIIHCDSDDWVDKDAYRLLYEKAVDSDSDMVVCDWFETDGENHVHFVQNALPCSEKDILRGLISRRISASLWNRLVRSTIIRQNKIIYPTAHMMEDVALSVQMTFFCKKINYLPIPLYYYCSNENSICKKSDVKTALKRHAQACANVDIVLSFLKANHQETFFPDEIVMLKQYPRIFIWKLLLDEPRKYYQLWHDTYPEINWRYPFVKGISLNLRIVFFLMLIRVYPFIYKLIH